MWRQAFSEIRLHPGRFVATLIAIAISVGFIAAISVFVNSQQTMFGKLSSLGVANADLVVQADDYDDADELGQALGEIDGVESVYPVPTAMTGYLSAGDKTVTATVYPVPPEPLRWAQLTEGRYPTGAQEIALSKAGLDELDASLGSTLHAEGLGTTLTVVGVTDDPRMLWSVIGYAAESGAEQTSNGSFAVLLDEGNSPEQAAAQVRSALDERGLRAEVLTGEQARTDAFTSLTAEVDIFKQLLQGFGAIALLVGMITIANTFTILAAQRRRQLGLLRAIGATPGQVRGRLLVESFLLGATGSLLGIGLGFLVAWAGGSITGSNYFGLTVQPLELLFAWLAGVAATMLAAVIPSLRAAQVRPLEALQVVPTAAQAKRAGVARVIICALAAAVGIWCTVLALGGEDMAVLWAVLAGAALSVAVLGAAPLYVAPLLALLGKVFGAAGPTTRMAFANAARNPRRAASTATALMLAVGLIVTLQAALATARTSGMATIEKEYPIDVVVSTVDPIPATLTERIDRTAGVQQIAQIETKQIEVNGEPASVYAPGAGYATLGVEPPNGAVPADGVLIVNGDGWLSSAGSVVTVPGKDGPIELTVKTSSSAPWDAGLVSEATFDQIDGDWAITQLWVKLRDRTSATDLNQVVTVLQDYPDAMTDGSGAMFASILTSVLDVMLIVLTALLGVAVVIALVGVGNTLGLSVIERQRESALLRALGMQRSGLRLMLLVEAVAMVGLGTVIGLAAGSFFGWLGVRSVVGMMPEGAVELRFALDAPYTVGLILVCLLAAVLASILPGRKAANATPTEALAVE